MLDNGDSLLELMKDQIDKLLISDEKLQKFLSWINEKSCSLKTPCKPAAIRFFYFILIHTLTRTRTLDNTRKPN